MARFKILYWLLALLGLGASATASDKLHESDYRNMLCRGMDQEVELPNGTRADCTTDRLTIEVDWTHKWAEAIGQSLLYAADTGKMPAIILVCKLQKDEHLCQKHEYQINEAVAYWHLPITVWLCSADARRLDDCTKRDYLPGGTQSGQR